MKQDIFTEHPTRYERPPRTILVPSGILHARTASHRPRTALAPSRTASAVRALVPLAPVPIKAPCGASAHAGAKTGMSACYDLALPAGAAD